MEDIFYPGMPDWLNALNQLAKGQLQPIQIDWNAAPGSVKAILNKPDLTLKVDSRNPVLSGVIGGDMSNGVHDARVLFRTTAANAATTLGVVPNGAGPAASINFYAEDHPANCSVAQVSMIAGDCMRLSSAMIGTGTYLPMKFYTAGFESMVIGVAGNISIGSNRSQDNGPRSFDVQNLSTVGTPSVVLRWVTSAASGSGTAAFEVTKTKAGAVVLANTEAANSATLQIKTVASNAVLFTGGFQVNSAVSNTIVSHSDSGYAALGLDAAAGTPSYLFSYGAGVEHARAWFDNNATLGAFNISVKRAGQLKNILVVQGDYVYPAEDNTIGLGSFNRRWTNVYAATGAIQTSDAEHKTAVIPLDEREISAAMDLAKEIGKYQFLDAVAEKGEQARYHIGMTVQRAIAVMEAHGLDPLTYGFICHDEWGEVVIEHPEIKAPDIHHPAVTMHHAASDACEAYDEVIVEGFMESGAVQQGAFQEVRPAGSIYSFRPDQLNLFIMRGQAAALLEDRKVIAQIHAQLETALERIDALEAPTA
ncbi:tail fiber domain-containing protein [Janthinobacterium sp. AD80]|uniref:tail fiber domain-containing protein n=1 Tax=Janthinobacterium sp. AD80 TaxID=1528773 RepID=UPI000C862CD0|nr:tail fiber domain-containing protein [Janthinobacterium sp. AD80]PMQ16937.1 hypothetical protein JaAD80_08000 [Janthinobacterium sp. AD80]